MFILNIVRFNFRISLSIRIPVKGNDELSSLASSINEM
ncbi:HAMP domain-containing protein, partial [Clostridioides difficile]